METSRIGMHPELEEPKYFHGLHTALNVDIMYWLAPRLPESYAVSVEKSFSLSSALRKRGYFVPDIRIDRVESPATAYKSSDTIAPPQFSIAPPDQPGRLVTIRGEDGQLVTTIEVLSPSNKRPPGLTEFRMKQQVLAGSLVHLVEIDLLRKGTRRWEDPRATAAEYLMTVLRGGAGSAEVWTAARGEALPVLPVPLLDPDPNVPLPLERLLREYLEKSGVGKRLDKPFP